MTIKLTREEAIQDLKAIKSFERYARGRLALDVAIEALEGVCFDEWCDDCKEYDTKKKCCPRFNRVIRGAMKREPSEDGTLEIKVEDATKVGRVLISDDEHRGGLYYPDEDEPQGISFENDTKIKSCSKDSDLISRQAAIDALYDKGSSMTAWGELLAMKWSDIQKCIEQLPSADRPMVIKCEPFLSEEDFKTFAEQVRDQNVILIPHEAEVVSTNTSTNTSTKSTKSTKSTNISTDTSADRPKGEWVSKEELIDAINDAEFVYDGDDDGHKKHDISELVRVMFKGIIDNLSTTTKGEA